MSAFWVKKISFNIAYYLFFLTIGFALASCNPDDPEPRKILGHGTSMKGVFHGEPKEFADRYCEACHGLKLTGGDTFQPSCFQCHGRTWKVVDFSQSRAPSDHIVSMKGFMHHSQLRNPTGFCNACHGYKLEGGVAQRTPSCYLCHDKKW